MSATITVLQPDSTAALPMVERCPMCRREGVALLDSHIWPQAFARKIKRGNGQFPPTSRLHVLCAGRDAPDPDEFRWIQDYPHEHMLCAECEAYSKRIEDAGRKELWQRLLPVARNASARSSSSLMVHCRLDYLASLLMLNFLRMDWSKRHALTRSFSLPELLRWKMEAALALPRTAMSEPKPRRGFRRVHYGAELTFTDFGFAEGVVAAPHLTVLGDGRSWIAEWLVDGVRFLLLLDAEPEEIGGERPMQPRSGMVELSRGNFFTRTELGRQLSQSQWLADRRCAVRSAMKAPEPGE